MQYRKGENLDSPWLVQILLGHDFTNSDSVKES